MLEVLNGKQAVDVLHLFREMLVDIIGAASFSYNPGAIAARAAGSVEEHYLVRAVDDFAKRGILVRFFINVCVSVLTCSLRKGCFRTLCGRSSTIFRANV
jgi:hypothetical protein